MFEDIVKKKEKEWGRIPICYNEIDLTHLVPEMDLTLKKVKINPSKYANFNNHAHTSIPSHSHKHSHSQLSYGDIKLKSNESVYYKDIELGTPEEINKALNLADKLSDKFIESENKLKLTHEKANETIEMQKNELKEKDTLTDLHKVQINTLADFIIKNYGEKICGSAVDTTIDILSNVKSIEYNDGSKTEYENGVIVGANGPI